MPRQGLFNVDPSFRRKPESIPSEHNHLLDSRLRENDGLGVKGRRFPRKRECWFGVKGRHSRL